MGVFLFVLILILAVLVGLRTYDENGKRLLATFEEGLLQEYDNCDLEPDTTSWKAILSIEELYLEEHKRALAVRSWKRKKDRILVTFFLGEVHSFHSPVK